MHGEGYENKEDMKEQPDQQFINCNKYNYNL